MEFGWNLLWFIVGVSLLVTVHEYGHFWVARKLGFKVLRFSIGFGKPLVRWVGAAPDHTEYVIAALPLGGYVKLVDERDGPVNDSDLPRAYASKRPWQRILMLLAGPGANFVFAIVVLWGLVWVSGVPHMKAEVDSVVAGSVADKAGLKAGDTLLSINGATVDDQADAALALLDAVSDEGEANLTVRGKDAAERTVTLLVADPAERHRLTEPGEILNGLGFEFWKMTVPPEVGEAIAGGPAATAGIQHGDIIESIDSSPVHSFNEIADYVNARPDTDVLLAIKRGDDRFTRRVHTTRETEKGRFIGRLHIKPQFPEVARTKVGALAALGHSVDKAWQMTAAQATFFGRMLTGKISYKNLSSPIGIAGYAGESAHGGVDSFLTFLVLISLSLGFLNLLPIPILDGGQIVFALTEWVKGSPLSERAQAVGWHAGLLMLVLLMGVAVFNDLSSRFGQS